MGLAFVEPVKVLGGIYWKLPLALDGGMKNKFSVATYMIASNFS